MTDSEGSTFIVHYHNKEGDPEVVVVEKNEGEASVYQSKPIGSTESPVVVKSNPVPPTNVHDKKMIDLFFRGELCLKGVITIICLVVIKCEVFMSKLEN